MKIGFLQQHNTADTVKNIERLCDGIRDLARRGAELIVLQELHNSLYFCQVEDVNNFDLAEPIPGPSTDIYGRLAKECGVVLVTSLFERRAPGLYHNTAVVFEKDGTIAGKYRKMHIPDDPGYYEKFYFTPGDLGFHPIQTSVGCLGVLVCWDQWYPEAARLMAMQGAELLIYPTAIGYDPNDTSDEQQRQRRAWQTVMRGHAVANGLPVVAVNRVGKEPTPNPSTREGSNDGSYADFWGTSFVCGPQGEMIYEASENEEESIIVDIDMKRSEQVRRWWPFFRDRRIDAYGDITRRFITPLLACLFTTLTSWAQPAIVHSRIGQSTVATDSCVVVTLEHKMQQFNPADRQTLDTDIYSPKSANISPDGTKFYINSLEGCATVAYEMGTWRKLKVISHQFDEVADSALWAPPSGLFHFTHYTRNLNTFRGKPVESAFSHGGRYLWVPYYRRTYDINAQDPSAVAVIDTQTDSIVRMMETGPLPKMVACSHDGRHLAITHWGDNTVGLLNIEGNDPKAWHYEKLFIIDYQLKLNYSLTQSVNRDVNSGYTLRGTVFTPDDHYLLVGCMGGGGGIAVIDMERQEYLGRVLGMRSNVRHLILVDDWLYLSINGAGYVQRVKLDSLLNAARSIQNHGTANLRGWEECKVMAGARTIEASPSGRFIFAACNAGSKLCIVDTRTMKMVGAADVDSYPVGLDISKDGSTIIVTSQGRTNGGGNAVNIFHADYAEPETPPVSPTPLPADTLQTDSLQAAAMPPAEEGGSSIPIGLIGMAMATIIVIPIGYKHFKRKK